MSRKKPTAKQVIEYIARVPPSKDFELDKRGEIKSGSNSYGVGYALFHVQDIAKSFVDGTLKTLPKRL